MIIMMKIVRKKIICSLLLISIAGLLAAQTTKPVSTNSNAKKPLNVLFISIDDLRPELHCYGKKQIYSPHIEALASQGVLFNKAYCQQAVCSPSRSSMLTGQRPDVTGVYDLETNFRDNIPNVITLPQFFKLHGYQSISLGKIYHTIELDDPLSWSEPIWNPMDSMWNIQRGYLKPENIQLALKTGGGRGPSYEIGPDVRDYPDDWVVDSAIKKMEQLKDEPFFLAVGITKPHLPFNAPKRFWDLYDPAIIQIPSKQTPANAPAYALANSGELRNYPDMPKGTQPFPDSIARTLIRGYYACVSYMDDNVGRLLQALKKNMLDKNTIIILWGDHGWKLGEYAEWCKHTNYEVDTRTALMIAGPGVTNKGKTSQSLVELVDVYPTLADLCHLPVASSLAGKSLVPLLQKNVNAAIKPFAVSQYPRGKLMGYSFRTQRYHLIRWGVKGQPNDIKDIELYDHETDSAELKNVAKDERYAKVLKELMEQSNDFLKRNNASSLSPATSYLSH